MTTCQYYIILKGEKLMNFRFNLKFLRKKKGFTQETLAQALNIKTQTVINWEQGKSETNFKMLEQLTQILDCSYDDLLK